MTEIGGRSRVRSVWLPVVAAAFLASCGGEQQLADGIVVEPLAAESEVIVDGFIQPFAIAVIDEDEYLVTERVKGLYHYENGTRRELEMTPEVSIFDALGTIVGGAMDVSLHPEFESNGMVYMTFLDEMNRMSVARFDFSNRIVEDLEVIFETNQNSIGAVIAWQDSDHFFVSHGATALAVAQDLDNDGGAIHRLTADGSVPEDNPVFDGADGPSTIWSYGHRVVQGLFIEGDDLYATEHGDQAGDEFNLINEGGNYGWPNVTSGRLGNGDRPTFDAEISAIAIDPVITWPNETLAPTDLIRVRDSAFPELDGRFLFGSLGLQSLMSIDAESGETTVILEGIGRVRDVDQLPGGDLVVVVEAPLGGPPDGRVLRLSPAIAG